MAAPRSYWMVNVGSAYYEVTRARGHDLLGMGKAQKRRVQRMEVGDRVLFYVSGLRAFSAIATIGSAYFEDHTRVWELAGEGEDFAWRVRLRPSIVLKEEEYIDARLVAPRMQYVRKWTPEEWPLAFRGLLHLIPKEDFGMLEEEMRKRTRTPHIDRGPAPDAPCALDRLVLSG